MPYAKITEFITIDPATIIATLLNLLILFLILKFLLFKRVNAVIESRSKEIADSFEEADETKLRAKAVELEYNEKLAGAKEESAEILRDATRRAHEQSEKIISDAHGEAQEIIERAHSEIEREKRRAVNSVKNDITDIAFDVAEALVGKKMTREDDEAIINSFIDEIDGVGDSDE